MKVPRVEQFHTDSLFHHSGNAMQRVQWSVTICHRNMSAGIVVCRMLDGFYSSDPTTAGRLQSSAESTNGAVPKCLNESLPVSQTLPAVLFWSVLDIPLWFTASGLVVYIVIVIAGVVGSLAWAALLS